MASFGGLLSAGFGAYKAMKRNRARQVKPIDIKDVTIRAVEAQGAALEGAIQNAQRFGADFLTSQIGAQESALPEFFRRRGEALKTGDTLVKQDHLPREIRVALRER